MYRDDPLDDEMELREVVGDDAVDALIESGGPDSVATALDVLRVLQGWVADPTARSWFLGSQRRLDGRTPIQALVDGDDDVVVEAAEAWSAAQG
jgi:hypothetical protein